MTEPLASQIVVVAIPSGTVANSGSVDATVPLRALVVPQLRLPVSPSLDPPRDEKPLSDFGMADWPAAVNRARFTLHLDTAADPDATGHPVTPVPNADSNWWRAFFGRGIGVRPIRDRPYGMLDCPATTEHARRVTGNYTAAAEAYLSARAQKADPAVTVAAQFLPWRSTAAETEDATLAAPPATVAPDEWSPPDFHTTVSMLRSHPAVLKRLGLIIEFTVPVSFIAPVRGVLRLGCEFASLPPIVSIVTPWTSFAFLGGRFLPAPADSDERAGLIDLARAEQVSARPAAAASDQWSLVTFDVEGAVSRLKDGAQQMNARTNGAGTDVPSDALPVVNSAGIALLRKDRKNPLAARLANSRSGFRRRLDGAVLTADDLTFGYNVDVIAENAAAWTPLCARTATYACVLGDRRLEFAVPEEAPVAANAASIGTDGVVRTDELLFRWTGWCFSTPRPIFDQSGLRPPVATPSAGLPFDFDYDFVPAGLQVPLRFGRGYRFRVRLADMAGGGLIGDDLGVNEGASGLVQYRRHEPVMPPEFAPLPDMFARTGGEALPLPDVFGPGATMSRLVIRSDPMGDQPRDVGDFDSDTRATHGDATADRYEADRTRTIVPPPTSMVMAEQFGVLDGSDEATWRLAQRAMTDRAADPDGRYTWLPDPAASGVQAFVRPTGDSPAPGLDARVPWTPPWPEPVSKRLMVRRPDFPGQQIDWHTIDGRDTLVVPLEAGAQAVIELSSTLDSGDLDKFEIRRWAGNTGDGQIADGRHPMVTPPRVVEFVHAVRRPLATPSSRLVPRRDADSHYAVLADGGSDGQAPRLFGIHRASTGQLDIRAQWREPVDDETPGPLVSEEVASLTVGRDDVAITNDTALTTGAGTAPDPVPLSTFRHEFGDTRHRIVTYTLTACSRYREYFPPATDHDFCSAQVLPPVSIPSSARPAPPVVLSVSPAFIREFIDDGPAAVRHLRRGRTVRIELARPWNGSGDGERLAVVLATDGSGDGPSGPDRFVSRCYRDPIHGGADVPNVLHRSDFLDSYETATCTIEETGDVVDVVVVDVFLDRASNRWYADVQIPLHGADDLYSPLVRLAVARYQPESIAGRELSRVVMTDFVPLMPDRALLVDIDGSRQLATVQLTGAAPADPRRNAVIAVVESTTLPDGALDVSDVTAAESGHAGLWHRDGQVVTGALNTPLDPLSIRHSGVAVRIVVREIEDIASPIAPAENGTFAADLQQRTVFMDVVVVSGPGV